MLDHLRIPHAPVLAAVTAATVAILAQVPRPAYAQGLPDLVLNPAVANPNIVTRTFGPTHCEVLQGCVVAGTRKLLQMTGETRNIGDGDLVLGDPAQNPIFEWNACCGHYQFSGFAAYRLLDATGEVAAGRKYGFCLLDTFRHDPTANPTSVYHCSSQGIQAGWADVYSSGLPCQYLDVTDVPPGSYTFEMEVNADRLLFESDYSNNVISMPLVIGGGVAPPQDDCVDALPITTGSTPYDTTDATTDGPAHAAEGCTQGADLGQTANDIWFEYAAACSGTLTVSTCEELGGSASYDTDLVIYDGNDCGALTFGSCNDDDPLNPCGAAGGGFHSTTQLPVVAGNSYLIRVGGWQEGNTGQGVLYVDNDGTVCGGCGNLIVDPGEACDPPDGVHCDANCQWICGDGVVQAGEDCDPGVCVECPGGQACGLDCNWIPICGNAIVEGDELCDPPNGVTCDDGCVFLCTGCLPGETCDSSTGQCQSVPTGLICLAAGSEESLVLAGEMATDTLYTAGADSDPALDNLTTPLLFADGTFNAIGGGTGDDATLTIDVPETATYNVWGRFYYPALPVNQANSFHLAVDGGPQSPFGNQPLFQQWQVDGENGAAKSVGLLTAGPHTLTISKREVVGSVPDPQPRLDVICLRKDTEPAPTDAEIQAALQGVAGCQSAAECDDNNVCTDEVCNAGTCEYTDNANACNDGSVCTLVDTCSLGGCIGGSPRVCDDGNPCTTDSCHSALGCQATIIAGSCDDGLACTSGDVCFEGECRGVNECPLGEACNASTGICEQSFTHTGTQPGIERPLLNPQNCGSCHGDYDATSHVEPWNTWSGSMMGQAGRDPIFWAALDVANNDLPEIGAWCLRCHAPKAWLEGRAQPPAGSSDGCGLIGNIDGWGGDFDGLDCHTCHRMIVNGDPPPGESQFYLENGQFWIDDGLCNGEPCRWGPYDYPADGTPAQHAWGHSTYVESADFCGTCHNVTSPALTLIEDGVDTGVPFPIERTYDEWFLSDFGPGGALSRNCQDCHMPDSSQDPVFAANSSPNNRTGDLPVHQFAGGNAWIPDVLRGEYPNLAIDVNLIETRNFALDMLQNQSASVQLTVPPSFVPGQNMDVSVRVTNLTGHKLPTGYPEGRRMWINVQARDGIGTLLWESAAYDPATAVLTEDSQAKVYEIEHGIWNHNGTNECDVVDPGGNAIFHFVLNDCVALDNRIPPLGFAGAGDIETRPVAYTYPQTFPGSGVLVNYDDTAYSIAIPAGTIGPVDVTATLYYQTSSKDYIEFLADQAIDNGFPDDCIDRSTATPLLSRGEILQDIWTRYDRSPPVAMTSGVAAAIEGCVVNADCDDGNPCTDDACDGAGACTHPALTDGAVCDDAEVCTDGDTCQGGVCVGGTSVPVGCRCGDVSGDGVVAIADALLTAQLTVVLRECNDPIVPNYDLCDINPAPAGGGPDGACGIGDALKMAQCSVGLVSCDFTCELFVCPLPAPGGLVF